MASAPVGKTTHSVVVLVDFDNVYDHIPGTDLGWLGHETNKLVALGLSVIPDADYVSVRLYGGWLEHSILTPLASDLQGAIASRPYFPLKHPTGSGLLRGDITLVTRLLGVPSIEWPDTRKQKRGLPRIRLSKETLPEHCVSPAACPVNTLSRFTKHKNKRCPTAGCAVKNADAFLSVEQKMVDTMIACDVVSAVIDRAYEAVLVVSDDADVIPAVALAGRLSSGIRVRLMRTRYDNEGFEAILGPLGVESALYTTG